MSFSVFFVYWSPTRIVAVHKIPVARPGKNYRTAPISSLLKDTLPACVQRLLVFGHYHRHYHFFCLHHCPARYCRYPVAVILILFVQKPSHVIRRRQAPKQLSFVFSVSFSGLSTRFEYHQICATPRFPATKSFSLRRCVRLCNASRRLPSFHSRFSGVASGCFRLNSSRNAQKSL